MVDIRSAADQVLTQWSGLDRQRRNTIAGGGLIALATIALLVYLGARVSYVPLFTNLSPEDATEITSQLDSMHVTYSLGSGGAAIMVPEDRVHELRIKIAGQGLPRGGGVGFEVFDKPAFGQSRFAEKLNYKRALEGELRRTIREIGVVKDARVHIALPDSSVFADERAKPSASVTLHVQPGKKLSSEQIQAIVHMVASSVEGLSSDDITLVDNFGAVLAKGGSTAASLEETMERQRAVETDLEQRVRDILERAVGKGNVSAKVSVDLDHGQFERTTETYDPESAVLRSEQTNEETSRRESGKAGAGATAGGVPGTRSNLAGGGPAAVLDGTESTKRSQTKNYELNKVVSKEVIPTGRLKRLSVAVLVDGIRKEGEDGKSVIEPRGAAELAHLTELAKRAVGFDSNRGDEVAVQSVVFDRSNEEEPEPPPPAWQGWAERLWLPSLITILALSLSAAMLRKRKQPQASVIAMPRTVRELEADLGMRGAAAAAPTVGLRLTPAISTAMQRGEAAVQAMPAGVSENTAALMPPPRPDPRHAAAVVQSWLGES